jgi:competence protein ComEA
MIALPPLAILLLGWLGRFATNGVATASAASSSASTSVSLAAETIDGGADVASGDALDADVAPEAPASAAIETLPDGGILVDLNLAGESDLQKLPGVGPSRARAIVALRTRLGRLKSVDDLARIKGFGRALVRRLRPLVRT